MIIRPYIIEAMGKARPRRIVVFCSVLRHAYDCNQHRKRRDDAITWARLSSIVLGG